MIDMAQADKTLRKTEKVHHGIYDVIAANGKKLQIGLSWIKAYRFITDNFETDCKMIRTDK